MSSAQTRFWEKVRKTDSCWLWTATKTNGYGQFWTSGRLVNAHRWSYEALVGPIPDGLQLDHLCRTRACVNPEHLEPVTCRENNLRGAGLGALSAQRTRCPQGHEYAGDNLYVRPDGARRCRQCDRTRSVRNRDVNNARRRELRAIRALPTEAPTPAANTEEKSDE